ncbi:MAG TPA: ABC transporter permease, partial [Longimicrobiales bacterium]|nr:ABC transporter permease [Longimicrobiales bacterium]
RATRVDVVSQLKEGGNRLGGRRAGALDRALITAQIALALLLVMTGGLLTQTLRNLRHMDAGFDSSQLLLVAVDARGTPYERTAIDHLHPAMLDRVRRLPGVRSAALTSTAPVFGGNLWISRVSTPGYVAAPEDDASAIVNPVTTGYFATAGIRLLRGRDFAPGDGANSERLAIVSESFARKFFPQQEALGNVVYVDERTVRVIGVAADARYFDLREPERPLIYTSLLQSSGVDRFILMARTTGEPNASAELIRQELEAVAPGLSPRRSAAMEDAIADALVRERLGAILGMLFGAIALGLAALGLYGVIAYSVAARTVEIGTRMALGARRGAVLWLVLRQSLVLMAIGVVLGIPLALTAARALGTQLFGVRPFDPLVLSVALLVLGSTGLLASILPARRATQVDPITALR